MGCRRRAAAGRRRQRRLPLLRRWQPLRCLWAPHTTSTLAVGAAQVSFESSLWQVRVARLHACSPHYGSPQYFFLGGHTFGAPRATAAGGGRKRPYFWQHNAFRPKPKDESFASTATAFNLDDPEQLVGEWRLGM